MPGLRSRTLDAQPPAAPANPQVSELQKATRLRFVPVADRRRPATTLDALPRLHRDAQRAEGNGSRPTRAGPVAASHAAGYRRRTYWRHNLARLLAHRAGNASPRSR